MFAIDGKMWYNNLKTAIVQLCNHIAEWGIILIKRLSVLLAFLTVLMCSVGAYAIDTTKFPTPPTLYAQSAILMDADTGQILYGKNERAKMYPASLTKIMTCMLALEMGKAEDAVTVTGESTQSVAGTTHIALRDGEKLTLSQLEYAMMVESANDAANAIAIHLSGSIPMFAQIMTDRARELGAQASHFENPSGLPNSGHYTTAYDLALITRAAMQSEQFVDIVSTQRYEIPPTNMVDETRTVTNKNYMFTLNDTYDGAYGGKTGWTQQAGHCLMTLARRDGMNLICIVLKSDGIVDAEFADSTALLDYGFDNFRRITVSGDAFPRQQVNYVSNDGLLESAMLESDGNDATLLLPGGVDASDVKVHAVVPDPLNEADFDKVRVELWVPDVAGEVMGRIAGSFNVRLVPMEPVAAQTESNGIDWAAVLSVAGILLLIAAVLASASFFAAVQRAKRARRRMMMAGIPHPDMSNDTFYWLQCHEIDLTEPGALDELRKLAGRGIEDKLKIMSATRPGHILDLELREYKAWQRKAKQYEEIDFMEAPEQASAADNKKSASASGKRGYSAYPAVSRRVLNDKAPSGAAQKTQPGATTSKAAMRTAPASAAQKAPPRTSPAAPLKQPSAQQPGAPAATLPEQTSSRTPSGASSVRSQTHETAAGRLGSHAQVPQTGAAENNKKPQQTSNQRRGMNRRIGGTAKEVHYNKNTINRLRNMARNIAKKKRGRN